MSTELFSLAGRAALVTGGNGGLGRTIALGLREAGARVAVTGRDAAKNATIGQELGEPDSVFALDVRDEDAVTSVVAQVAERYGRFDILVNNAGLFRGGSALSLSREDWDAVLATHLTGAFLCAKHAANAMIKTSNGGKIINIGSMYSLFGPPRSPDYAAAKTGVIGLTRALAVEFDVHLIQVNAILPGWYETDLTRGLPDKPFGQEIRRRTAAGRWGDPRDLVGTAVYLAAPASDFVTGITIPVDGGYSVSDRLLHE